MMAELTTEDMQCAYKIGKENDYKLTVNLLAKINWPTPKIFAVFNKLSECRICVIKKSKDDSQLRNEKLVQTLKKLDVVEYLVFCCIENSGNQGISTTDIRKFTNIPTNQIQKASKQLLDIYKLIKQIHSIHYKSKKIFILADLEPSQDVVGGFFYSNGEFNYRLVNNLRNQICQLLHNKQTVSVDDMLSYLKTSECGNLLSEENLRMVIRTLELEQIIQMVINPCNGKALYMLASWSPNIIDMRQLPCGSCPIFMDCHLGGGSKVSPENCEYMSSWLGFDF